MGKLAAEANVNIKTNNLTYAATSIAQLARGLEAGAAPASPAAPVDPGRAAELADAYGPENPRRRRRRRSAAHEMEWAWPTPPAPR